MTDAQDDGALLDPQLPGFGDEPTEQPPAEKVGRWVGYVIAVPLVVALLLGAGLALPFLVGWAIYQSDPGGLEPKADAGYLDLIVSTRWVVWWIRGGLILGVVAVAAVALYVTISVVVRTSKGQWLRSGAGLHADIREVKEVAESTADLLALLDEAQDEKDELLVSLADTTDRLEQAIKDRDWMLDRIGDLAADLAREDDGGEEPR